MKLAKITVTGADDHTQIPDILRFIALYPRIEFGILVNSPWSNLGGHGRYPSFQWIERLAQYIDEDNRVNFSLHLCGKYVDEFFTNRRFVDGISMFTRAFSRMQVNTHNYRQELDLAIVTQNIADMLAEGVTPILQYDHANSANIDTILANVPPHSVHCLYDMSHGAGVLPEEGWTAPLEKVITGYAGGLSKDNVGDQLVAMSVHIPAEQYIWINAETHLRNASDRFDLFLVEDFYKNAARSLVVKIGYELL